MRKLGLKCCVGVLISVAALQLTGCGKTVQPDRPRSRFRRRLPADRIQAKRCALPVGSQSQGGRRFDCGFTGPEGPYVAHMRITKVAGDDVEFDIKTQPRTP